MGKMMSTREIALARLALRELERISVSVDMLCQYGDEIESGSELDRVADRMSRIGDAAHKLSAKLEGMLLPFALIEVEEIY